MVSMWMTLPSAAGLCSGVWPTTRAQAMHDFGLAEFNAAARPHAGVLRQPELLCGFGRFKCSPQLIPGRERAVGVHDTDQATGCFYLYGDW
ncbi:hypothetical protein D3C79_1004120 [compost metagenome]